MTATLPPIADLTEDGARVVMRIGEWRGEFPVAQLPYWLKCYRGLRDRDARRFAKFYEDTVEALERVSAELASRARAAEVKP